MKTMINRLSKFYAWMNGLKNKKKALIILIGLDAFMAIGSNIADWHWLMSVKWYLLPVTPICSLYPLTLAIWFTLRYFGKKIPTWYTTFIFIGIVSYGIMAYIYYPLYMNWDGIEFRLIGNMIWVTIYAMQSLIIASELKTIPIYQYLLIIGYFAFKDFADRYLGTFVDVLREDFPERLKEFLWACIIMLHIGAVTTTVSIPILRRRKEQAELQPQKQELQLNKK